MGEGKELGVVVRAVICLFGHHMLVTVHHEVGKLIYSHSHVNTSRKLGRCAVKNSKRVVAYEKVTSQHVAYEEVTFQPGLMVQVIIEDSK